MKKFSEFAKDKILDGDKIKIEDILNTEIIINGFTIKESRYSKNKNGEYLTLQIIKNNRRYVVFTGSDVLIEQIKQYENEMPFSATIKKINRYYTLT